MTDPAAASHWMTDNIASLFYAEISNEQYGGVSPATVASTIDSVSQAADIMCKGWKPNDFAAFLAMTVEAGGDAEVRDLLRQANT